VFDLFDKIQITAGYSNAVLVAILPHVTDFAQKLDLPMDLPVTTAQVQRFMPDSRPWDVAGRVQLTNGYSFRFDHGYVSAFRSPLSTTEAMAGNRFRELEGQVRMSADEVVEFARSALRRLGHNEEDLYVDLKPEKVEGPVRLGRLLVPHYVISWADPRFTFGSVRVEVDAGRRRVTEIRILPHLNIARPPPKVDVTPVIIPSPWPDPRKPVEGERAEEFLIRILPELSEFARKLDLPVPQPIRTNDLRGYVCWDLGGVLECEVVLTNGYSLSYNYGYADGFAAPDRFFASGRMRVRDFVGRWRMTSTEAVALVRNAVKKLGYDLRALGLNGKPEVERPHIRGKPTVPRFQISWDSIPGGTIETMVSAEVDADKRVLKRLSVESTKLVRERPKLPIGPGSTPGGGQQAPLARPRDVLERTPPAERPDPAMK